MTSETNILDHSKYEATIGQAPMIPDLRPRTAKHLRTLADAIDALNDHSYFYAWQQPFMQISEEWAAEMHAQLNVTLGAKCQSIYSLHLVDGPDAQSILNDLKTERSKGTHKYPRLGTMDECRESTTLYVGSSRTTPSRMLQHLGTCAPSTYGLRLSKWATQWVGSLRIEVRTFDNIDAALLQILEDHLAYLLKPITGKRGGK